MTTEPLLVSSATAGEAHFFTVGRLVAERIIERPMDGNHGEIHPKGADFVEQGIPFVMASDLVGGTVDVLHCQKITEEQAGTLRKGFALTGDVLLSHKATIGRTAIVPRLETKHVVLTPQVTYYRVADRSRLDNRYLKYYFDSPPFQQAFESLANSGSTRAYLSITGQLDLPVLIPPLETQLAIASVLGSLDDKIEANRRMSRTLEAMARTLFRSWFVDFDPVRAKAGGHAPAGLDAETAALFPDRFEASALGNIPAGWRVAPIGEVVRCVGGATPSTVEAAFWGGEIPFATPKDLAGLGEPVLLETERKITPAGLERISSGLLPAGTVLLSSRAPIGYLAIAEVPVAVNQGFVAMVCDGALPNHYAIHWARENMEAIESRANGTTFPEISKAAFRPIEALVPPPEVLRAFTDIVGPLHAQVVANVKESRKLAALRDGLLPKLISGQMRVAP